MIKFFRKIRHKLLVKNLPGRQAGKFSRYLVYAVGEIVLVVIGILIALQINNWNLDAQARKQEFKVLSDLKNEFEVNRLRLDKTIKVKRDALLNTRNLLKMMKRDHLPLDEIKPAISQTFGVGTYNPSGGTINTNKHGKYRSYPGR